MDSHPPRFLYLSLSPRIRRAGSASHWLFGIVRSQAAETSIWVRRGRVVGGGVLRPALVILADESGGLQPSVVHHELAVMLSMSNSPTNPGATSVNGKMLENRQWWIAIGAIVVSVLLVAFGRGSMLGKGQSTQYVITVVPSDARSLACAMGPSLGDRRCGYDANLQPTGAPRPLQPFVTTGHELLLLSGVFESSSVAAWLVQAQKSGSDERVVLECYAKILGAAAQVSVRWTPDGPFQTENGVMSAEVEDCVVKR
jgi:hypothetical protein